jgi:aspartate aminotransferase
MSSELSRLSSALDRIAPSATLAMTGRVIDLKAQGIDVIGLSAGEPDFDTPDFVKDAAIQAIRDGQTKYTAVDGTAPLKAAIAAKFKRDNGIDYTPKQITVNSGGKHTLFNSLVATVDAGDEVIIPAPYWVSYPDIVQFAGGTPVIVMATAAQNYKMLPEQLEAAITPKTRWLILNSPSNPTGAAYNAVELEALGQVLIRHPHVMLLTDDMYEHIWYAQSPFATMLQVCPELYDRLAHWLCWWSRMADKGNGRAAIAVNQQPVFDQSSGSTRRAHRAAGLPERTQRQVQGTPRSGCGDAERRTGA